MARTVPVYTAPGNEFKTDFWGLFDDVLPVSETETNVLLEEVAPRVASLQAVGTGIGPPPGNDRRLYLVEGFEAEDVEAYVSYTGTGGSPAVQGGLVARVQPGGSGTLAPIGWQNIFLGATGGLIPGCWDFTGSVLTQTNQHISPPAFNGYPRSVATAVGNGTTVTVTCSERHWLELPGAGAVVVRGNPLLPGNPFVFVSEVVSPTVFRFLGTEVGTQPGGVIEWLFWPAVERNLAVRLVNLDLTVKQWPTPAPEPSWGDLVKTGTVTLPGTLLGGVPFPSGEGRAGFVAAHLGTTGRMDVTRFLVRSLD